MKCLSLGLAISLLGTATLPSRANVQLASLFNDNMVLQRDSVAPIWGTADPGDTITVMLRDQKAVATVEKDGTWKVSLAGLKVGAPANLIVAGSHNTVTIQNVAVGDVWITAGQSNMQYKLADKDEIGGSANPNIRYFETPLEMSLERKTEFAQRLLPWKTAAPGTAAGMSAVAYYFAKEITRETGVPIGIIDCAWGGTAEAWTSRDALELVPEYKEPIDEAIEAFQNQDANAEKYPADMADWEKSFGRNDPGNSGVGEGWATPAFDASSWATITTTKLPNWNSVGIPNGGAVWLRKTVSLPPEAAGKDFTLLLGSVPGADTAYFNGEQVGSGGWTLPQFAREPRAYKVPGRLVKSGDNVIAIRIFTQSSKNATFGVGSKLGLPVTNAATISDDWQAHIERQLPPMTSPELAATPPYPYPAPGCSPTVNFNAMVCPLSPYGVKGILWYQGESNTAFGYAYRTLLPLLIQSWRAQWKRDDLPFYIVQLPNLGTAPKDPEESGNWAVLRESQLMTWKKVPNTGMSVNIDIGEANNLHPHDKKDVGHRLALVALANVYGRPLEASGPIYDSMTIEGDKIRVKFSHVGGGLVAKGGTLQQFAIAGSDRKFVWADAVVDGDSVVVSSPSVAAPVAVRYAWANNPAGCNLSNKADLPASPFRTDDWPTATQGAWYPARTGTKPAASSPPSGGSAPSSASAATSGT